MAECREILNDRNGEDEQGLEEESPSEENEGRNFVPMTPKLSATDEPTERLLMKIARHVKYIKTNLSLMATDVRMAEGIFTQKTAQHLEPQMKIIEVINIVFIFILK